MIDGGASAPPLPFGGDAMKFSQQFFGVIEGEIYPRVFKPGEDCPPELLEAAKSVGAVETPAKPAPKTKAAK